MVRDTISNMTMADAVDNLLQTTDATMNADRISVLEQQVVELQELIKKILRTT